VERGLGGEGYIASNKGLYELKRLIGENFRTGCLR